MAQRHQMFWTPATVSACFGKNTHLNIFVLNLPVPSSFLQVDAHIDAQGIKWLYSAMSIAIYSYIYMYMLMLSAERYAYSHFLS